MDKVKSKKPTSKVYADRANWPKQSKLRSENPLFKRDEGDDESGGGGLGKRKGKDSSRIDLLKKIADGGKAGRHFARSNKKFLQREGFDPEELQESDIKSDSKLEKDLEGKADKLGAEEALKERDKDQRERINDTEEKAEKKSWKKSSTDKKSHSRFGLNDAARDRSLSMPLVETNAMYYQGAHLSSEASAQAMIEASQGSFSQTGSVLSQSRIFTNVNVTAQTGSVSVMTGARSNALTQENNPRASQSMFQKGDTPVEAAIESKSNPSLSTNPGRKAK